MAIGLKRNETRARSWAFKGDVAIHAAKLRWRSIPAHAWPALNVLWANREKFPGFHANIHDLYHSLPFMAVTCVVTKTGCEPTEPGVDYCRKFGLIEFECGNYEPGRFYYPTDNARRLSEPLKVPGKQGVFEVNIPGNLLGEYPLTTRNIE